MKSEKNLRMELFHFLLALFLVFLTAEFKGLAQYFGYQLDIKHRSLPDQYGS